MSVFGHLPVSRIGHIEMAKILFGYLTEMKHAFIRLWTGLPYYSDIPYMKRDWKDQY